MLYVVHTSLKEWLESLRLTEYLDVFTRNNFTDVEKLRKIWEVELTTVQITDSLVALALLWIGELSRAENLVIS